MRWTLHRPFCRACNNAIEWINKTKPRNQQLVCSYTNQGADGGRAVHGDIHARLSTRAQRQLVYAAAGNACAPVILRTVEPDAQTALAARPLMVSATLQIKAKRLGFCDKKAELLIKGLWVAAWSNDAKHGKEKMDHLHHVYAAHLSFVASCGQLCQGSQLIGTNSVQHKTRRLQRRIRSLQMVNGHQVAQRRGVRFAQMHRTEQRAH